jgi:integrase
MTGHVQDLWMRPGPNGRKVKGPRHGKGKRWQARYIQDGGEKAKAFDSKDGAEAFLARIAVHGPEKPRPRITFGEYADTWRGSQLHHRQHTVDALNGIFDRMLKPQLGRLPVAGITRTDIQNAVIEWAANYAPATVTQAFGYTRTILALAVYENIRPDNPCKAVGPGKISLPEKERRRVVPLTAEQVFNITEAMPAHLKAAVTLGAATGLRIGELGGLDRPRVHGGIVTVDRQLVEAKHGIPQFGPPKTDSSYRDVTTGAVAWEALQSHLETYSSRHGLVFGTSTGSPLDRRRASEAWRAATKGMTNLPLDHGFHALRHFHASLLIAAGLSPRAVADRLGHSTVSQTLATYSHLWPTDDLRSTAAIDSVLGPHPNDCC